MKQSVSIPFRSSSSLKFCGNGKDLKEFTESGPTCAAMCSLVNFPPPPPSGYVTICERHADLLAATKSELDQCHYSQNLQYPEVNISQELLRPSMSRESARSAFLEGQDTPHKRFWRAWYEHGLTGVLEELATRNGSGLGGSWLSGGACAVLAAVRWVTCLHGSLFPHLVMSSEDLTAAFSPNLNWKDSYIRCFAWHPHTTKFAIALRDNSVKVFTAHRPDIVPTLKHKLQKGVADLAWKPASASILAVACQSCVLIWNVEPTSLATRPSTSSAQVLSRHGHWPVTSLAWCPQGTVLTSSSPTDTAIMAWDVASETCIPLKRVGGGGISLLSWSPDGSKLLSACPTPAFRVWETRKWNCEKWTKLAGRCQAACWSPSGTTLLFATTDNPAVYSLTFPKSIDGNSTPIGGSRVAVKCMDLSEVEIATDDGSISVGGVVQNMVWDPTGERLAIQFQDVSPDLIALFQTRLEPVLEVIPCGFVKGLAGEVPHLMSFQPSFKEGALLTVVWSNGRVAYIPLYFVPRAALQGNQLHQHHTTNGQLQRTALYTDS